VAAQLGRGAGMGRVPYQHLPIVRAADHLLPVIQGERGGVIAGERG
jgi:hypothetical protein